MGHGKQLIFQPIPVGVEVAQIVEMRPDSSGRVNSQLDVVWEGVEKALPIHDHDFVLGRRSLRFGAKVGSWDTNAVWDRLRRSRSRSATTEQFVNPDIHAAARVDVRFAHVEKETADHLVLVLAFILLSAPLFLVLIVSSRS